MDIPAIIFFGVLFYILFTLIMWLIADRFEIALVSSIFTIPLALGISFMLMLEAYHEELKTEQVMKEFNLSAEEIRYEEGLYYTSTDVYSVNFFKEGIGPSAKFSIDKIVKTGEVITPES